MKVVVLTGPESSGKTFLADHLQRQFGGLLVGEYVRHFIEQHQRDTCFADIPAIARGQLVWEDAARAEKPELLILDTHLLSNMLWSHTLFGECPPWLEDQLLARHYDLHLLLSPHDVEWHSDGQRCQPDMADRERFHQGCHDWLQRRNQNWIEIRGDWAARKTLATEYVGQLIS